MTVAVFNAKAPGISRRLMADFPGLIPDDTFAILGNLGHESGGLTAFQEVNPTVPGSAGGWGWAQWTGPRRKAFDAWIAARGIKDPKSDEANYGFLVHELRTTQAAAIKAVQAATGLYNKVVAFERAFERAGIKHYDSRMKWAARARAAYASAPVGRPTPTPTPKPVPVPVPNEPAAPKPKKVKKAAAAATGIWAVWYSLSFDVRVTIALGAVVAAVVIGRILYKKVFRK